MSDYDDSASYTVLAFIGLILCTPLIVLFCIYILPMIEAIGYMKGWWSP
jgi:hypothetical protein